MKCHPGIRKDRLKRKCYAKHAKSRGRITTLQKDRYVFLVAKGNKNVTHSQRAIEFAIATSTHVSSTVIPGRISQAGLYA